MTMPGLPFFDGWRRQQRWDVPAVGGDHEQFPHRPNRTLQVWVRAAEPPWEASSVARFCVVPSSIESPGFLTWEIEIVLPPSPKLATVIEPGRQLWDGNSSSCSSLSCRYKGGKLESGKGRQFWKKTYREEASRRLNPIGFSRGLKLYPSGTGEAKVGVMRTQASW